jgi:hypothetical protein
MASTTCLVCLVSTVSGCHENALGRGSASSRHITKLEQSTFVCLVSTVSGCHKNALGRGSASSRHITKLEQSTFH